MFWLARYDNNSSNFRAPLRADADTGYKPVEVLPKPLCDKWAWVRWDYAGRPPRSEAQANEEYETGIQVRKKATRFWRICTVRGEVR
jgi:alpha-glucan,water dikinase